MSKRFSFQKHIHYVEPKHAMRTKAALWRQRLMRFRHYYRFFEISYRPEGLPKAPVVSEKHHYIVRSSTFLVGCSVVSFGAMSISTGGFIIHNPLMWPLSSVFALTVVYFVISLSVNASTKEFDLKHHYKI